MVQQDPQRFFGGGGPQNSMHSSICQEGPHLTILLEMSNVHLEPNHGDLRDLQLVSRDVPLSFVGNIK